MPKPFWETVVLSLFAAVVAFLGVSCQTVGGRTINVEFRSSEGLQSGDSVYLAGVQIGEVNGPQVVGGASVVPVQLYRRHKDAVPAGTVFLLTNDEKKVNRRCLIGYGASLPGGGKLANENYRGASNWVELVGILGAEKAQELWKQVTNRKENKQ